MLDLTCSGPLKIAIGTPTGGDMKAAYTLSLLGLFGAVSPEQALLKFIPCQGSNIAENQNEIVEAAEGRGADYILFVETDMAFPSDALSRLLAHGKDIVGAVYPFKDRDLMARKLKGEDVTYRYMGHDLGGVAVTMESLVRGEALRKVDFVPMGLTLIRMNAVNAVRDFMSVKSGAPEGMRAPAFFHNLTYPADRKRGIVSTTDSAFCAAARDAGLEVWLDATLSLEVEHIGEASFGMIPDAA